MQLHLSCFPWEKNPTIEVLGVWFYYPVWKGCIGYLEWILDLCFVIEQPEHWLSTWVVFYCQGVSEWPGWSRNLSPKLGKSLKCRLGNAQTLVVFQQLVALLFCQHFSNDQITEPENGLDWKGPWRSPKSFHLEQVGCVVGSLVSSALSNEVCACSRWDFCVFPMSFLLFTMPGCG